MKFNLVAGSKSNRLFIEDFKDEDIKPRDIRFYSIIVGYLLGFIGKSFCVQNLKGRVAYLNKKSFEHWVGHLSEKSQAKLFNSAIKVNDFKIAKMVLKTKPKYVKQTTQDFLLYAIQSGCLEAVTQLLQDKHLKNQLIQGLTPHHYALTIACRNDQLDIIQALLQDPQIDPSINNNYVLQWACQEGHVDIVKTLLQDTRVFSIIGEEVLEWACQEGHVDIVKDLLKDQTVAELTVFDYPLQCACREGHLEIVKEILAYQTIQSQKINQNLIAEKILIALEVAKDNNQFKMIELLMV